MTGRFTNQSTEQSVATNVVGLVHLDDFRKRRAEALEQQERAAREAAEAAQQGVKRAADDDKNEAAAAASPAKKKKAKKDKKDKKKASKLSFGDEEEEEEEKTLKTPTPTSKPTAKPTNDDDSDSDTIARRPIKSFTQQALKKQAAEREALRKEYLALQAAVKAADVAIPFVFYEGASVPGGTVRVKKGDYVWQMLDRSRKAGARLGDAPGASASGPTTGDDDDAKKNKARMHWARINVDDLMLVRGNLIIPHHYDFYYFIVNKTLGPGGQRIFDYTDAPASSSGVLEGAADDPAATKVVDRRWYERNKHIYPATLWQEFDPAVDYPRQVRRDPGGNPLFHVPQ